MGSSATASRAAARRRLFAAVAVIAALVPATALSQKPDQQAAPADPAAKQKQKQKQGQGEKGGQTAEQGPPKLDAKAWILIDPRDDTVLAAGAPNKRLPIASATKLMTARIALEKLNPKRKLTAPAYNAAAAESLLGLHAGERMRVRDLLYALLLPSANDAAVTLAKGVSGTIPRFVARMNREAAALGLDNTSYGNPVGLDSPDNYSSAADLAHLASILLKDPLFAQIVDTPSALLRSGDVPRRITSRNTLLEADPTVDGVKTGHTGTAGYVLVASATRDGTRLISAVLGTRSEAARDAESEELLNYGFEQYKPSKPVKQGTELADPKLDYRDDRLGLVAERQVGISARKGQKVATEVDAPGEVSGDIEEGEKLGSVLVTVDGRPAGASPLVASESVSAATLTDKVISTVKNPIILLPLGAIVILLGLLLAARRRRHRGAGEIEPPPQQIQQAARPEPPIRPEEPTQEKPQKQRRRRRDRGKQERTPEERRKMHEERMRRRRERKDRG